MKKLLIVLITTILIVGCATLEKTDPTIANEPVVYVFDVEGATKDELYKRSLNWVAESYKSAEHVLTFKDQESGVLKGRAIDYIRPPMDLCNRGYNYDLSIYTKDNKAKIEFSGVTSYRQPDGTAGIDMKYKAAYDLIMKNFDFTASDFEKVINTEVNSNW